ncbi:MAG TPA: serine hydrolase domain-containing protein [Acidothermaceae bacterium]
MSAFEQLSAWPVTSAAAGVTDAQATLGAGGDVDRPQPWASVTKLITAYGVLRLLEVGEIDLDEPAGPEGATVRHVLAHASGLNLEGSATIAQPGRRRIYSNGGFQLLGGLIATRTGASVGEYLTEAVLRPLNMTASTLHPRRAATGGHGPVHDLLKFARELLAPTLVDAETLGEATSVVFPGLDGVLPGFGRQTNNDWGLGFEIRDHKQPHWTGTRNSPSTFGHFGQQGSFLWVDPAARLACVALTGTMFGEWVSTAWPPFSDAVLAEYSRQT